jgi:hypothetical protein
MDKFTKTQAQARADHVCVVLLAAAPNAKKPMG